MAELLPDIIAFCEARGMPQTKFGELAMSDTAFVLKLQRGRRVWPETEAKARDFMASYDSVKAA
jgi:hypothetical protein